MMRTRGCRAHRTAEVIGATPYAVVHLAWLRPLGDEHNRSVLTPIASGRFSRVRQATFSDEDEDEDEDEEVVAAEDPLDEESPEPLDSEDDEEDDEEDDSDLPPEPFPDVVEPLPEPRLSVR
jgi:hypothetical protein